MEVTGPQSFVQMQEESILKEMWDFTLNASLLASEAKLFSEIANPSLNHQPQKVKTN